MSRFMDTGISRGTETEGCSVCPCWPINGERKPLHCSGWVALAPIQSEHGRVLYVLAYRVHDPPGGVLFRRCAPQQRAAGEPSGRGCCGDICVWQHEKKVRLWGECDDDDAAVAVGLQVEGVISQLSWRFRCPDVVAIGQSSGE